MEPIVFGISGVTCGGKSSLCERIAQKYPSTIVFSMDDYYIWPDVDGQLQYPEEYNNTYANFEVVSAVNFDQLYQDVEDKIQEFQNSVQQSSCPIMLVEGILIFDYRPLQKYFARRYFLTLPKDVAEERRRQRTYDPPDPVDYFEKYAWPYYIKHKESLVEQRDIIYIDGSTEADEILRTICHDLENVIADKKISI